MPDITEATQEQLLAQLKAIKDGGTEMQKRCARMNEQYGGKTFKWASGQKKRQRAAFCYIHFRQFIQRKGDSKHLYGDSEKLHVTAWPQAYPGLGIVYEDKNEEFICDGFFDRGRYVEVTKTEMDEMVMRARVFATSWCDAIMGNQFVHQPGYGDLADVDRDQEELLATAENHPCDFPHVPLTLDEQALLSMTPYVAGSNLLVTPNSRALVEMMAEFYKRKKGKVPDPGLLNGILLKIQNPTLARNADASPPLDEFARVGRSSL